jgi:two-component system phosphate regulon sensor histidine kinase PhoR
MSDVLLYLVVTAAAVLAGYRLGAVITRNRMRKRETRADAEAARLAARVSELEIDRARMAAVFSGMVEGVLAVDGEGRLRVANDTARRMLNLDAGLFGRHYVEAVRQPNIIGQLDAALKGAQPAPTEVTLAANGAVGPRIFRVQGTPAAGEGGAVLVLHDITDLRLADRVRRDFVANVSHELRTPLTAVRGYVEALMDEPVAPEKQRQFLEVIDRHTGRMERLVRDLLRLARLDAQQEKADVQNVDVAALFDAAASDLSERIERQRLHVDVTVKPAAAVIKADVTKMHDALRNLIENAVNYSSEGGHIELEAHADGDRVRLSVGDFGPGIPDADLGRVFERFYRVDKSRTSDAGGTGLGLSIVRHLIELQGGKISAANRPEGGAVFTIALPHRRNR